MSKEHSTASTSSGKPAKPTKPRPDYPLFAHASGQWAKKIRGRLVYFGVWSDPDAAEEAFKRQKDDLHAGRKPRVDAEGITVKDAVNAFLRAKEDLVDSGELSKRTWEDYKEACDEIVGALSKSRLAADLQPDDFATLRQRIAKKWGPPHGTTGVAGQHGTTVGTGSSAQVGKRPRPGGICTATDRFADQSRYQWSGE